MAGDLFFQVLRVIFITGSDSCIDSGMQWLSRRTLLMGLQMMSFGAALYLQQERCIILHKNTTSSQRDEWTARLEETTPIKHMWFLWKLSTIGATKRQKDYVLSTLYWKSISYIKDTSEDVLNFWIKKKNNTKNYKHCLIFFYQNELVLIFGFPFTLLSIIFGKSFLLKFVI